MFKQTKINSLLKMSVCYCFSDLDSSVSPLAAEKMDSTQISAQFASSLRWITWHEVAVRNFKIKPGLDAITHQVAP